MSDIAATKSIPDSSSSQQSATTVETKAEPKKSFREKLRTFAIQLKDDYVEVFWDTYEECKTKPGKATAYLILLSGLGYLAWSTPDEKSFHGELTAYENELDFISPAIRNPTSEEYIHQVKKLKMWGRLRYQSFGFFSIMWKHDESEESGIYKVFCKYTKPRWSEVRERLVDFGAMGKWWILEEKMTDYDINPTEWEKK